MQDSNWPLTTDNLGAPVGGDGLIVYGILLEAMASVAPIEVDTIIELEGILCAYAVPTRTHCRPWQNLYACT